MKSPLTAPMLDDDLLDRLLRGGRIAMAERVARNAWPHPPLKLAHLVRHIAARLDRETVFPRPWVAAEPGKPVHEGGVITRESAWRYVYRVQRHHPLSPTQL